MPPRDLALLLVLAALAGSQQSCPSSCYCDAQLSVNCVGDTLWPFPAGIPAAVTRLELRNYVIPTLGAEQLAAFTNLTELKAPQNSIASIENGTFSTLAELRKIDLSQNEIAAVSTETFDGLSQAQHLDLSSNRLAECEGAFSALSSLEQLTLRGNNLARLGPNTLAGLGRLQYLNIDSNSISNIDVAAFQTLTSLAHLILSNNPLANLSRLEFFGSRLQYIDVSAVGLTRVPQSLTQNVRDLRLAKNNFTVLRRGDFDSYPYLGLLVLDDSGVQELEEDTLGRHEYLMRLWMNGNLLERVPASLPPSLKALYLEENRVAAIRSNDFSGLEALEQLFLQRNLIETVEDCAFCGLTSLKTLDLQANQIQRLSAGSFSGLIALEWLDISQNPITVIEEKAFAPFLSLKTLQMSRIKGNISMPDSLFGALERLERLDMFDSPEMVQRLVDSGELLRGIRGVQRLNIMHNQLRTLRSDLPQLLPKLQQLKLGGSRWDCSSPEILWLTEWMAQGRVEFYSPFSARCWLPLRLRIKSIALLQENDFETAPGTEDTVQQTTPVARTTTLSSAAQDVTTPTASPTTLGTTGITRHVSTDTAADRSAQQGVTSTVRPSTTSDAVTLPVTTSMPFTPSTVSTVTTTSSAPTTMVSSTIKTPPPTPSPTPRPQPTTKQTTRPPTSPSSTTDNSRNPTNAPSPKPTTARPSSPTSSMVTSPPTERWWLPVSTAKPRRPERPVTDAAEPARVNYVPTGTSRRGTMVALVSSMAAAVGVILVILGGAVCLWRYRRVSVYPFTRRRKDSSISYSQQKDEVSIEHDGCEETTTDSHHGLSNVLYFMSHRGDAELGEPARPRPTSLLPHSDVDACPRAVPDAWGTPGESPEEGRW